MYRIAEFAQLAGVTVRTLQYYDRIGLLKPSDCTQARYRLYTEQDLLRLQQVLWLKWLGFTLAEVKKMVAEHDHDWLVTFRAQKRTIDERIGRLQEVSVMLEQLLAKLEVNGAEAVDSEQVSSMMRGFMMGSMPEWVSDYYSDVAWTAIETRRLSFSEADLKKAEEAWQALFKAFEAHLHEPPATPAVQELAAKRQALVEAFTGGNSEIHAGLERLMTDAQAGKWPAEQAMRSPYANVSPEVRAFMEEASRIYHQRSNKNGNAVDSNKRNLSSND